MEEVNEFKLPDDISNNPILTSCACCDAENEELNATCDAALALNEVATDELKSPVTLATLADNATIEALLAENDVATDELKSPVTLATLADNEVILALLALKSVAIDELNVVYPVVDEIVICEEPLTTLSPPANKILLSLPIVPAFQ